MSAFGVFNEMDIRTDRLLDTYRQTSNKCQCVQTCMLRYEGNSENIHNCTIDCWCDKHFSMCPVVITVPDEDYETYVDSGADS